MSTSSKSPYPTQEEIYGLFKPMDTGDYGPFFARVSPDVDWTVMGTHPLAGRYTTRDDFFTKTIERLGKTMKPPGLTMKARNVIGGGEGEWATAELIVKAECFSGLKFDNTYSWCMRFNKDGIIVEVRAYLDSWMVREAIVENECPSQRAPVP